ncbi:protein of unknown function [Taphrina deformans PYCC 5710]|uniref:Uncharacterized protein n=1 Tax=Taphrina deformans (strain PYCC 5710 / ATCC 11124 / CBS 356.35 / IMI 108563 / JCM 9778 / NBRC 8474) TaxID=1097556 RepID=R4XGE1_TAPDE|nr:protein of unknown function [Taphrina deformans PYCC 5710]|eukprot:CCG84831.1 protein of unknown function [Taphrina deformans PYCC 5710]
MLNWASLDARDDQLQSVFASPVVGCIQEAHSMTRKGTKTVPAPSITGMLYGPSGYLITACSANPMLKTWDLRYLRAAQSTSNAGYYPLLQTSSARPQKHLAEERLSYGTTAAPPVDPRRQRTYGVASLALSHDGQRIYSVNRDNKVYEYVTSHPHMGPTKVFDAPNLQIKTFYCKAAISKDDFLVCGNYSGSPVVIDTKRGGSPELLSGLKDDPANDQENRDAFRPWKSSGSDPRGKVKSETPSSLLLSGGHDLEVTGVSWSFDSSSFVSISDDKTARLWRRHET